MREAKIFDWTQYKGAEERYSRDLSAPATQRGTTVSTIAASSVANGVTLTIDEESVTSGIWYGRIAGATAGDGMVKLTITFADGDVTYRYFKVKIEDPEYGQLQ